MLFRSVLPVGAGDWLALAAIYNGVAQLGAASAVLAAIDLDCQVLTGQPDLYSGLADGGPIIPL